MGCGKACNRFGLQHAAEKLDGSLDLDAGAALRLLAHFGLLVQLRYYVNYRVPPAWPLPTIGMSAQ